METIDLADYWGAAVAANSDPEFSTPRTLSTAPVNALQASEPVTDPAAAGGAGAWDGFWQTALQGGLDYLQQRDLMTRQQRAITPPTLPQPAPQTAPRMTIDPLWIGVCAVGVVGVAMLLRRG